MTEQTPPVLAERPPYFVAGLVALGALLLYVTTLAPTTQFWDSSEHMAAAHALGIPHPPGNHLFIILCHAWGLLPLCADYARLINLFAAITSAAPAAVWSLIGERWSSPTVPPPARWPRRTAGAAPPPLPRRRGARRGGGDERLPVSPDPGAVRSVLERRRADDVAGAQGRADPRAVRQAVRVRQPDVPARPGQSRALAGALRATALELRAILHVAVRPRLVARRAARLRGRVRRARPAWRPAPLARGAPGRARHDDAAPDPHARVGVLPQFPVGLLPALPGRRARARGARAGLLLHRLVRVVGDLGGDGTRRRDGVDRAGPGCAPARGRPALGAGDAGAAARARPARRQPAHRFPGGRDHGARLRSRRAAIGGPLRARRDGGRQRHVPAVVRAGGRGRAPGRERPRALARQYRLVPAPAAAPAPRDVRFAGRARVVSDAPLAAPADAVDGPLLPGGSGRLAPGLRGAVAAGDRATRTHRRRARSPHAGAALPHALRSRGARDRQGSAGQAADLLLDLDGELRRPARPVALPRG